MLSFAAPLALLGLLALPGIYLLLRVTPPRPNEIAFPPTRILRKLKPAVETKAKTPWPLLLLRLATAALIAFAMAGPIWSPAGRGFSALSGPALIAVDDGWAAAPGWDRRLGAAVAIVESAARVGAPVALAPMSEAAQEPALIDGARALEKLRALRPKPYLPDRGAAARRLADFARAHPGARIVWIADGLEQSEGRGYAAALREAEKAGLRVEVLTDAQTPLALAAPLNDPKALSVAVLRPSQGAPAAGAVLALDEKGRTIARAPFDFGAAAKTTARFELPVELRNEARSLRIEGERSAGAVALLDSGARVKRVAMAAGVGADERQPLLSPLHYLERALAPFAQTRQARPGEIDPVSALLEERPNVFILADASLPPGDAYEALTRFVEEGGLLLRFAGPRLAEAADDLTPVRLRRAGRVLGGAMSWETPKTLAPFDAGSPFAGLAVGDEVSVARQVLAEPDPGLVAKTWARLSDGTPLVTAERRGKGLIVLFHVNADANWSNLSISGLFVDMLKRVCALAGETAPADGENLATPQGERTLAPLRTLDGFGALGAAGAGAKSIPANFAGRADANHPPGLYGASDAFRALQTVAPNDELRALDFSAAGFSAGTLDPAAPLDLRPVLLALVFGALLADILLALRILGRLRVRAGATAMVVVAALAAAQTPAPARAEAPAAKDAASGREREAALTTRLAYVRSGDTGVDNVTRNGMEALSRALEQRTSFSPGEPAEVDPEKDELAFYPMLYWPVVASAPQPSQKAVARVAAYMKQGGVVVFDTRDALTARRGGAPTPETAWLREMARGLDLPPLEIAPRDHVITKTFYLLDGFVGRYANGEAWVEALPPEPKEEAARPVRAADSVSPVVIVSNDLAAGWARDAQGQPMFPLTPGGPRQREMALRGGINLAMYTLTGNYKSDQVHVRDLLERLGQ